MRRQLLIPLALLIAMPLLAEETRPAPKPAEQVDSPMVAAAKRANRAGRKPVFVITNESLKTSGSSAHVTTTVAQPPVPAADKPAEVDPAVVAMRARAAAEEKKRKEREELLKKRMEEERQRRLQAASEAAEQSFLDDAGEDVDPAAAERQGQEASPAAKPPVP